jgi:hypothetical protein
MPSSPNGPIPKRRTWRRWPPEALEILRQNKKPVAICEELASLTGKSKGACWTFMTRHGIQRPGSATRHTFDRKTCDKLVEYISNHGVHAAAQKFGYNTKSLYNLLYRQERTKMSRNTMSLRQLSVYLRMRFSQVRGWVEHGLLRAQRHEFKSGAVSYLIEFEELRRFCKKHPELLLTSRSCPGRISFLEEFLFAPRGAGLLHSRASRREAEAFAQGENIEKQTPAHPAKHRSFRFSKRDSRGKPT